MSEHENVSSEHTSFSQAYLLIHNISKLNNVIQLIKLAFAYGLTPVIVGCQTFRPTAELALAEGGITSPRHFERLEEAKGALQVRIVGIEIDVSAVPAQRFQPPLGAPLAFLPGNEGTGLTSRQRDKVDLFVFVPQFGQGTASLNVHVATTLVLHEVWMKSVSRCI
ncbi:hypothetical protein EON64_19280 [archaeon]|nr:MAG: hypothetical protein EON64_19280 [archaeon]